MIWRGVDSNSPAPFAWLPSNTVAINVTSSTLLSYDNTTLSSDTTPMDWLAVMEHFPRLALLDLSNCSIFGSLPASIPSSLCFFYANRNNLTGIIPLQLYSVESQGDCDSFAFSINHNAISGSIPPNGFDKILFPTTTSYAPSYVNFLVEYNQLTGPIPSWLLCPTPSGGLLTSINIGLSYNQLSGEIPSSISCNLTETVAIAIGLGGNQLSGDLPLRLQPSEAPKLTSLVFFAFDNPLGGLVPFTFLESLKTTAVDTPVSITPSSGTLATFTSINIRLERTGLTGTVKVPDLTSRGNGFRLSLRLGNSPNLTGLSLDATSGSFLELLDASNSRQLTGTIPSSFWSASSVNVAFDVSNTSFSGTMPVVQATRLASLVMQGSGVNFCDSSRSIWTAPTSLATCDLTSTNASYCAGIYPSVCSISSLGPVTTCAHSARPSASFVCVGGIWTSIGSIDTPTLTIPAGATTTVVSGNLTTSTVVMSGAGSTVIVTGCISNLSSIELDLTTEDLETIGKTKTQILISSDASCQTDLSNTTISLKVQGNTCKRASVSPSTSSGGGTLSGMFTINSSRCNTWWIILVSVVCGVIVLVAILALIVVLVPSVRRKIRPFHKARTSTNNIQ